ncbi:hypothetical protein [Nonomuraea sp. NPDC050310]|uniref:hypothetical protein n=1 Tax=Nonomuraea sp. NPDC050310 TaxID=3154935 RepID=UPI00340FD31B
MNRPGDWCERPGPQAPSCELPSPFKAPKKPDEWCGVQESPVTKVVDFLLRVARR